MPALMTEETANRLPTDRAELVALMRDVYREQKNAAGKKVLSMEEIKQAFLALPGEGQRQYELTVSRYARDWADSVIKRVREEDPEPPIMQLLPKPGDMLQYGTEEEKSLLRLLLWPLIMNVCRRILKKKASC